jgi:hypothetical protein
VNFLRHSQTDRRPDPQAWLADTLARIADYKINRMDDLLP